MKRIAKLTIRERWEDFATAALPPDLPADERRKAEVAFWTGAASMYEITERIGAPDISEDRGLAILGAIDAELREFAETAVKRMAARRMKGGRR